MSAQTGRRVRRFAYRRTAMYEYTLKRSNRKTLALEITRELIVLVRAPIRLNKRDIDRFVEKHTDWITAHLENQRRRALSDPPKALTKQEIEALKQKARDYLPGRIKYYGALMGLEPAGIKITSARTRYGSCSGKNSLCFSCRLMLRPIPAVDLVVVHELAHIRHKNHGRDFYACIAAVLPDYKTRQKLLKGNV